MGGVWGDSVSAHRGSALTCSGLMPVFAGAVLA